MTLETKLSVFLNIILSAVLIAVLIPSIKMIIKDRKRFLVLFFTMASMSYLLSALYWVAYEVIRPGTRMPFAADEIADCAMILLLSASLETLLHDKKKKIPGELIFTFIYICANIALWIAWSGEWVQDIVFGLPYFYFLWMIIRGIRESKVLKKPELIACILTPVLIVGFQTANLLTSGNLQNISDLMAYSFMYFFMAWIGIKSIKSGNIYLRYAFFFWTLIAMYSCSGYLYLVATSSNILAVLLVYLAVKKETLINDIR